MITGLYRCVGIGPKSGDTASFRNGPESKVQAVGVNLKVGGGGGKF